MSGTGTDARAWAPGVLLLGFGLLALGLPVVLTPNPPLTDYPNHLAQMWLEAGGARQGPTAAMYQIDWSKTSSNLACDLIAAALGGVLPLRWLGSLTIGLAVILPPLGAILLNRSLFRRWSAWQVALLLLAWTWPSLAGFLNFSIALGLALIAAAAEPRITARGEGMVSFALRAAISLVLLVAHPFGLLFYGVLLCGLSLGERRGDIPLTAAIWRMMRTCLALPAAFLGWKLLHPGGVSGGADPRDIVWASTDPAKHMVMMLQPFMTYSTPLDLLVMAALVGPVLIAGALKRLGLHFGLVAAGILLMLAGHLVPARVGWAAMLDTRLPLMAILAWGAGLDPRLAAGPRSRVALLALAVAAVTARSTWIGAIWSLRQADADSVTRALTHLPRGAKLLPMENNPSQADAVRLPPGRVVGVLLPSFWHYALLAIPQRDAFVPTLFSVPGQHPIKVEAPYSAISTPAGIAAPAEALRDPARWAGPFPYLPRWRAFDYILLVNADVASADGPLPAFPEIEPVADEGFARLYRIRHGGDAVAPPPSVRSKSISSASVGAGSPRSGAGQARLRGVLAP
jgi:hypothetical protein